MLDLISEYCEFRNYPYERLDGRIRGTERQKAIDRFEREKSSFVFLLSTRAGGVGINLTAAGKRITLRFSLFYSFLTTHGEPSVHRNTVSRYLHFV
jgi:Helicase conserved C-terminal domain